jgi:hypothetical protein
VPCSSRSAGSPKASGGVARGLKLPGLSRRPGLLPLTSPNPGGMAGAGGVGEQAAAAAVEAGVSMELCYMMCVEISILANAEGCTAQELPWLTLAQQRAQFGLLLGGTCTACCKDTVHEKAGNTQYCVCEKLPAPITAATHQLRAGLLAQASRCHPGPARACHPACPKDTAATSCRAVFTVLHAAEREWAGDKEAA